MKKIAICGFADSWQQAPFDDQEVIIYGLNELHKYIPRWNEWIEIHDRTTLGLSKRAADPGEEIKRHKNWMAAQVPEQGVIWMQEDIAKEYPAAQPFPLQDIQRKLGNKFLNGQPWTYFTSSVAYMIAHCITRGRDDQLNVVDEDVACEWMGLYGVDLAGVEEYTVQRPCAELMCGIAMALGIKIEVAEGAGILHGSHMYGFQRHPKTLGIIDDHKLKSRKKKLEKTLTSLRGQVTLVKGALQETTNWETLTNGADKGMFKPPDGFLDDGD